MEINKFGLQRKIPSAVKAEVRRVCGYGCVVCGSIPYEYDHFIVPWVEAKEHDPDDIILLCKRCHHLKTGRIADIEFIQRAKRHSALDRPAHFKLPGTNPSFKVHWPANDFEAVNQAIVVDGRSVLDIKYQENELEPVLLSGTFRARDASVLCVIEKNELTFRPPNLGDLLCTANRFQVLDNRRRKALRFTLTTSGLTISDIAHVSGGSMVLGNDKGLWVSNGATTLLMRDVTVKNCAVVASVTSRWARDYEAFDISKDPNQNTFEGMSLAGGYGAIAL